MRIKNTKIWIAARKIRNKAAQNANYKKAKSLPLFEYEEYLIKRYSEIMNRHSYSYGKTLSFSDPKTFTEKCQWIKLYDQDERKPVYSDKYAVREHIKKTIGEEYLVPLILINGKDHFYKAEEIDFDKLPKSFVLKCNHGSHMNIIVPDKTKLSKKQIKTYKKQLNIWLKIDYVFYVALETQYKGIKPCIIIEQYLENANNMREFKYTYFSGKLQFFWISERSNNSARTTTTFKPNLEIAKFNFDLGIDKPARNNSIPKEYEEMKKLADILADNFTMVRVDFFLHNNKIYFSELTFNSAAGFDAPQPIEYDEIIGDQLLIDLSKREKDFTYRKKCE